MAVKALRKSVINGFYSSKPRFTGGLRVREWLSTQSFEEQMKFGLETVRRVQGMQ